MPGTSHASEELLLYLNTLPKDSLHEGLGEKQVASSKFQLTVLQKKIKKGIKLKQSTQN